MDNRAGDLLGWRVHDVPAVETWERLNNRVDGTATSLADAGCCGISWVVSANDPT